MPISPVTYGTDIPTTYPTITDRELVTLCRSELSIRYISPARHVDIPYLRRHLVKLLDDALRNTTMVAIGAHGARVVMDTQIYVPMTIISSFWVPLNELDFIEVLERIERCVLDDDLRVFNGYISGTRGTLVVSRLVLSFITHQKLDEGYVVTTGFQTDDYAIQTPELSKQLMGGR